MNIEVGDYVTRKSYNHDTVFKVINVKDNVVFLKGVYVRLCADSDISDLDKVTDVEDDFQVEFPKKEARDGFFYLPGKILHIDTDIKLSNHLQTLYLSRKNQF